MEHYTGVMSQFAMESRVQFCDGQPQLQERYPGGHWQSQLA